MGRAFVGIAAALLVLLSAGVGRAEDDAALRAKLLQSMRQGYAEASPGAPDLIDLLSDRFPGDLDALMDKALAAYKAQAAAGRGEGRGGRDLRRDPGAGRGQDPVGAGCRPVRRDRGPGRHHPHARPGP